MKTPKFQIKVDRNNRCKVYLNKKWQKDITELCFTADLEKQIVCITKYKRDSKGHLVINDVPEIVEETKVYRIK